MEGRKIGGRLGEKLKEVAVVEEGREGERERNAGSRGDSGIRFGCGTVATPARLGIQLTAARDTRSVRRFLHGVCNGRYDERPAARGGLDPDRRRNCWPAPSLFRFSALRYQTCEPLVRRNVTNGSLRERRKKES